MRLATEVSKLVLLCLVLIIAIVQYVGDDLMDPDMQQASIRLLLPAFFVFAGMVCGQIFAVFFSQNIDPSNKTRFVGFIVGLGIGCIAVLLYFLSLSGIVS